MKKSQKPLKWQMMELTGIRLWDAFETRKASNLHRVDSTTVPSSVIL
jgi:hypothetical protein